MLVKNREPVAHRTTISNNCSEMCIHRSNSELITVSFTMANGFLSPSLFLSPSSSPVLSAVDGMYQINSRPQCFCECRIHSCSNLVVLQCAQQKLAHITEFIKFSPINQSHIFCVVVVSSFVYFGQIIRRGWIIVIMCVGSACWIARSEHQTRARQSGRWATCGSKTAQRR